MCDINVGHETLFKLKSEASAAYLIPRLICVKSNESKRNLNETQFVTQQKLVVIRSYSIAFSRDFGYAYDMNNTCVTEPPIRQGK